MACRARFTKQSVVRRCRHAWDQLRLLLRSPGVQISGVMQSQRTISSGGNAGPDR